MKVKSENEVTELCPTLSDPMDCSLPGSSVHGIFQARVLECGVIGFSEFIAQGDLIGLNQHPDEAGRKAMAANFATGGVATIYGAINIGLAHQLPGKPEVGGGESSIGSSD